MRKGRDREKKNGKKKKTENTDENSGQYVIASSRLPERRPLEGAGTPHARAKSSLTKTESMQVYDIQVIIAIMNLKIRTHWGSTGNISTV